MLLYLTTEDLFGSLGGAELTNLNKCETGLSVAQARHKRSEGRQRVEGIVGSLSLSVSLSGQFCVVATDGQQTSS